MSWYARTRRAILAALNEHRHGMTLAELVYRIGEPPNRLTTVLTWMRSDGEIERHADPLRRDQGPVWRPA